MEVQVSGDKPKHKSSSTQTNIQSIELSPGYVVVLTEGAQPGTAGVGTIVGSEDGEYEEGMKVMFDVAEARAFEMEQIEYHMLNTKHIMGIVS